MQFKHTEILWALLLLLVPIIIHLFQLRRFKKTPFTNVKFLKRVVSESRKSSTIKKWLVLLSRLLLLTALVLAFAQPFSAGEIALQPKENVFYLDNSFSMQAKTNNGTLVQQIAQDFIKYIPENQEFTLFTNNQVFKNVTIKDIQNELLNLSTTTEQLSLGEITLKAKNYFKDIQGSQKNMVLMSDFQQRMGNPSSMGSNGREIHFIRPSITKIENVSIDSLYLQAMNNETLELMVQISTNTALENTPVSLYNGDKLIAKTSAKFNTDKKASVIFSLPSKEAIAGRIVVTDSGLEYDNQFYFTLNEREKINVLSIDGEKTSFLKKIFTPDEFNFSGYPLDQLNYGILENQNLVILNELDQIPSALVTAIQSFLDNAGTVTIIPARDIDLSSYNQLTNGYFNTSYSDKITQETPISDVVSEHPLYTNVFDGEVTNFQYPKVSTYYRLHSKAPFALNFQNKAPFLIGAPNFYSFSASLSTENSNFKNTPLIVPTFYNMGLHSLKLPTLYHTIGNSAKIEIPISLAQDNILKTSNGIYDFIPQQQVLPQKVRLAFVENPIVDGIFQIKNKDTIMRSIGFNYHRKESELLYLDINGVKDNSTYTSISDFFQEAQKNNSINEFWKWFAILALLFVLIETALQRFLK
ncbi:BatA domain-containing protein [Maribacter sp. 2304DJ31-5]|uniref:BatA domain-containing protein n=1 Tax=Maribacter sp. 2304DJ31-5 TaxID=3386273 RepID=UPI0039BCC22B